MEFFNREKEIKDLTNILSFEPNLIYFIYGPINSGKTALINEIIKKLPNDYIVFYIDLRAHFISRYDDFVRVLFKAHKTDIDDVKEFLRIIVPKLPNEIFGIPIPKDLLNELFKDKKSDDVFEYIIDVFEELQLMGKKPILIIDVLETFGFQNLCRFAPKNLQVIGDLKINGYLIYELFNFFISLTKHRHLAHILCLSSDSLFIDKVYNEAMLQDRCKYYLVDDFDYETTKEFLKRHGFNDEETETVWEYFGGKPIKLIDIIQEKALGRDVKEYCKKSLIFKVR
ncbi:ATP-binding protein [Methanotorris formicicus]|uniref:ATPase domain-containing protein n=1 Tax=Methanotorris formicicus Mc-S-70 TaxID=647171 RepID=H1L0Z6_9EURY|nr:hypothetical protein MetfoDRAFT_1720 [Methanotorris formicicus Mc-S-70]